MRVGMSLNNEEYNELLKMAKDNFLKPGSMARQIVLIHLAKRRVLDVLQKENIDDRSGTGNK